VVDNLGRYGATATLVPIAPNLRDVDYKAAARDPANVRLLRAARGIWFIGGNQQRITQALLNPDGSKTPALESIWDAYRAGAVIGGSSAGTAIMSRLMFADAKNSLDTIAYGLGKGEVDTGLGFIGDDWFVDQHFLTRGRFARALRAMHDLGFHRGIGVDEDTAVVLHQGHFEVVGYKGALILDLRDAQVNPDLPEFNLKGARLTYLDAGDRMDARTRQVTVSARKVQSQKLDPKDPGFHPYYTRPEEIADMLGAWAIYEAMAHALDSKTGEVKGLALGPWAQRARNDLGFEFRVYRGADTVGWYTAKGGNESYSVLNAYLDITPVKVTLPLFTPLEPESKQEPKAVLVIHGGAGVLTAKEMATLTLESGPPLTREHYEAALAEALSAGYKAWKDKSKKAPHVDAVEEAIRAMEDSELFNAGHGAALNHDGQAELDAAIMEGKMGERKTGDPDGKMDTRKRAGAVAAVSHIKNPISAARAVMDMADQRHVLLVGEGAEWFALSGENSAKYRIERVSNAYFWTDRRLKDIRKALAEEDKKKKNGPRSNGGRRDMYLGTVGAVALRDGTLAAGTSTGGLTNKWRGRVGDTPVLGAGTYADDRACGVSCTGTGEVFIRHAVAHDVVARMVYGKESVDRAAQGAIDQLPDEEEGIGGLIALDRNGNPAFGMSQRSIGMYRGYVTEKGDIYVAVYRAERFVRMILGRDGKWRREDQVK
jgi:cyanophycinase